MHTIFEITSNWVWKVASSFWGLKKPILERNRWMQQLIWGDSWDSSWVFLLFAWLMFFVMWVCADDFSPYMGRRTSSTLSLANVASLVEPSGSQSVPQRKKLLKAPSLAELDSSDSDVSPSLSVWEGVSFYFYFFNLLPKLCGKSVCACNPGWDCWTHISQQLQRGDIVDGWYIPRVCSGEEKCVYTVPLQFGTIIGLI